MYNHDELFSPSDEGKQNRLVDVLEGSVLGRKMDYLFWAYGLHHTNLWVRESEDPVSNFYRIIHVNFRNYSNYFKCPAVWMSLNSHCIEKLKINNITHLKSQAIMVNQTTQKLGEMLKTQHWPYYDADLVLRSPALCYVSADGTVHNFSSEKYFIYI
jgi:hypothetical protein